MNLVALSGAGLNTAPLPRFPARTWKYSWRRGLTQFQWVFPLSGSFRRLEFLVFWPGQSITVHGAQITFQRVSCPMQLLIQPVPLSACLYIDLGIL